MPHRFIPGAMLLLVVALGGTAAGQTAARASDPTSYDAVIRPSDVRPHIEFLAGPDLRGRSGADARHAAEYIRRHFMQLGLRPLFAGGSYFQEIPGVAQDNGNLPIVGRNV